MINLLLSAFSEFPRLDAGGANKIIYQILSSLDYQKFSATYHSSHLHQKFLSSKNLENQIVDSLNLKKKIGTNLFRNLSLFRSFLSSSNRFTKYLKRGDNYFEKVGIESNIDVHHSHDFRTMYFFKKAHIRKNILTIQSKGSFINDLKLYYNSISERIIQQYSFMENESLRIADLITFPSYAAKQLFLEEQNLSIDNNKIQVIYNGVDIDYLNSVKPSNTFRKKFSNRGKYDLIIINVADHIKVKNIDIIVKVIEHLLKVYGVKALLLNVGNGPQTKELKLLASSLNISDQIRFLGRLPYGEVIQLIKLGDFLISAAEKVIFDLIILEALACGLIVIANENGGNKEAIENGFNGYLVKDLSIEQIADTIIRSDRTVKSNAIKSALKYDVRNMVKQYETLYLN
jgi:glycosyltransferase involved in cell wall biosynthesis